MSKSMVSAVISSYQSADTLPRAVQSVLDQSYPNLEVVVVDNGSTDNTWEVLQELSSLDPRIRPLRLSENQRPAGGRNAGVQHASGEYIAFLDADDEWLPDKIQKQVGILDTFQEIGVVLTDGWIVSPALHSKSLYSDLYCQQIKELVIKQLESDARIYFFSNETRQSIYQKCFVNTSSVMLRRSQFISIGGFDKSRFGTEDVDLWVRLAKRNRFAYVNIPCVNRYKTDGALSAMGERWLLELLSYHLGCYSSEEYSDLMPLIKKNLNKYYKYLIISNGREKKTTKAFRYAKDSLRFGFFASLFVYAAMAPFGSKAYDIGLSLRKLMRLSR